MLGSYEFLIQSRKEDIDFINKIIEAYEGIGVVRTINAEKGIINIITTYDYKNFLKEILEDLNENWVKAEIIEEKPWSGGL
ncbi:MAG: DUF4911 domain-containing protein [Fusobacteriaceae bacterium]|nr:DUF4911 domain-containing protein [Fusobacteriaceae bacterium]MBP6322405.1 DUF4911 domain-containing protein [Fusobacteriaceae bacterium]MBP9510375.1 DUF4911 domain-containing protein [Fusobacteriaceae bacterium]